MTLKKSAASCEVRWGWRDWNYKGQ